MSIVLINRNNFRDYADRMVPGLERAINRTDLSVFWDFEVLWKALQNDEVFAFYQPESKYSGVFMKGRSWKTTFLSHFWSGQDPTAERKPNYKEIDDFLIWAAQQLGTPYIQIEGRRGWVPLAKQLGYKEDSTVFLKETPRVELQPEDSTNG